MNKSLFWFDEVEQKLIDTAHNQLQSRFHTNEDDFAFDGSYNSICNYINTTMYNELETEFYKKIEKLNSFELNRYLNNSILQNNTYKPELRQSVLLEKFWKEIHAPNEPTSEIDKFHTDFFKVYFEAYSQVFNKYMALISKVFNAYLRGLLNTNVKSNQLEPITQLVTQKLKTNLSVPQLAYLFKMLMDINPPIFDTKTKKQVYEFIEASFTTKGKEDSGPTVAKLNNLYSNVDKDTANFWVDKLKKMLEQARKL